MTLPHGPRGVLRAAVKPGSWDVDLYRPAPDLAHLVDYYWIVRWDLRGHAPMRQKVLSHPNVHMVFEKPRPAVYGVVRDVFERELIDTGHVFGIRFRPGGFRPFLDAPMSELTDRVLPAVELFGPDVTHVSDTVLATPAEADRVPLADTYLRGLLPDPPRERDPLVAEVTAIVTRITTDPTLLRVDTVADEAGISVRRLQRLFAEYVGVGPKWVLRRARLQEVAARAEHEEAIDWAAVAADLGYADQAHLTRDFTATVGTAPGRYAKS